jgi:hypothetical protein
MYLLNWNKETARLDASLGGHLTASEGRVFIDELRDLIEDLQGEEFSMTLDYSGLRKVDQATADILDSAREVCLFAGALKLTFVTREETDAVRLTEERFQEVMMGREEYLTFEQAA